MKLDKWYGEIPDDWQVFTVRQLIESDIIYPPKDGNHGNIHPKHSDFVENGIPFIMASDLLNGEIDYINCKKITKEQAETLQKGFAENGDILLSHKATLGRTAIVKTDYKYIILTPQVTYYRIKNPLKISRLFLYNLFNFNRFQQILKIFAGGGSTRDYIGITAQHELPILYPPFEEQVFIEKTISKISEKINLLRRQNETLEKIAQTLFKHWFIDFEFPNEEGKPYKSSGGAMSPSELGDIPAGWKVGKLGECLSLIIDYRGKTPKKLGMDWSQEGIPALSAKNIKDGKIVREDDINFGSEELYKLWMKDELKSGDILLTSEAPLGEVYYLSGTRKYILSQRLFALRTNSLMDSYFLYFWLRTSQGQSLIKRRETGSTVTGIRQVELKKVEIIIPPFEIIAKITNLLDSTLIKIDSNCGQIKTLTKTRDALLPKLMSGEIRIKE